MVCAGAVVYVCNESCIVLYCPYKPYGTMGVGCKALYKGLLLSQDLLRLTLLVNILVCTEENHY